MWRTGFPKLFDTAFYAQALGMGRFLRQGTSHFR